MATKKIITLGNLTTFKNQCDATYGKVKTVNSTSPDANGNVSLTIPSAVTSVNGLSGGTISSSTTINGDMISSYVKIANIGHETSSSYDKHLTLSSTNYVRYRTTAELKSDLGIPSGTIATTSDLSSYLPLSGGTMSGDIDFSSSSSWIKPYLLAFKNADTSSSPTYPYTGFYQWGNEWQVNARDSNNSWAHNLLTINLDTKVATFTGSLISGGNLYFGSSTSSSNYISTEDGGSRLGLHGISGIKSFNHIIPSTTESYDLGDYATTGGAVTSNKRWRNLYLSGNLSDGTNSISIANIVSGINSIPTSVVTSAKLNGSSTTSPSWYAPTSAISTSTSKRYLLGSSSSTSIATTNTNASCYMQSGYLYSNSTKVDMDAKQDKLVSGTNIKTINGNSVLGSGDLTVTATETVYKTAIASSASNPAFSTGSAWLLFPYGQTGTFKKSASGTTYTFYGPALMIGTTIYYSSSTSKNFDSSQSGVSKTPLYGFKGIIITIA